MKHAQRIDDVWILRTVASLPGALRAADISVDPFGTANIVYSDQSRKVLDYGAQFRWTHEIVVRQALHLSFPLAHAGNRITTVMRALVIN